MPFVADDLIAMMFGQRLQSRSPAVVERGAMAFRVEAVQVVDERLTVDAISLSAHEGEVIGLAGLDGSGQRPFLRACAGIHRSTRGRLWLGDQDITRLPYYARLRLGIAYAPAGRLEEGLTAGLSIADHFALTIPGGFWINRPTVNKRANESIDHYRIKGQFDSRVETLSGGNQQRVLLALLPKNLKVLLLENPTRGLDVESARWVWDQLLERRAHGTTIIFTSPELDEITEYSNRIGVFYGGQLTLIDDPRQITITQLGELIGGKGQLAGQAIGQPK
jgi:simple sugar transport system ATP-binding protein